MNFESKEDRVISTSFFKKACLYCQIPDEELHYTHNHKVAVITETCQKISAVHPRELQMTCTHTLKKLEISDFKYVLLLVMFSITYSISMFSICY